MLEVDRAGFAEWQPAVERFPGPVRELQYVLRAYDAKGNFDETSPKPLWMVYRAANAAEAGSESPPEPSASNSQPGEAEQSAPTDQGEQVGFLGGGQRLRRGQCLGGGQ